MSSADVMSGHNSYYILQLIESDNANEYMVYRKWGRLGTEQGADKSEIYHSKQSATKDFSDVYKDKTGNVWGSTFQKKPGKFVVLEQDYSEAAGEDDSLDNPDGNTNNYAKTKLPPAVQSVLRMLFDVKAMQAALVEMDIDLEKMPLGRLSKNHIQKGYGVLTRIQTYIAASDSRSLIAASNEFYSLIPRSFGTKQPPIINTPELLKQNIEMVESLLEMTTAVNMLKVEKKENEQGVALPEDPLDIHYRKLKADMLPIEKGDDLYKMIETYLQITHAETHRSYTMELLDVFELRREGEAERFTPHSDNHNRMLLWHGSRTTNYVGIISQGLRIAPPEAPVTGYMFGKGVYFADASSKSANYVYPSGTNNVGFMLLCEVALGDMYPLTHSQYMDKAPAPYLSTKGIGQSEPDPDTYIKLDDGVVVPSGKLKKIKTVTSLLYNEYIVYDVAQIRQRYMLKIRFNFNR